MNPSPGRSPLVLILVVAALVAVVAGGVGVGIGIVLGKTIAKNDGMIPTPARATMTRAEFRAAVEGKTAEEIIAAIGKPDSTTESSAGNETWRYGRITKDPTTGNVDSQAAFTFSKGRAANVTIQ